MHQQPTHQERISDSSPEAAQEAGICMTPPSFQLTASADAPPSEDGDGIIQRHADEGVLQLDSDCEQLNQRAEQDQQEGSDALTNALETSLGTELPFSFDTGLDGSTRINVRAGAQISYRIRSTVGGQANPSMTFRVTLLNETTGNTVGTFRSFASGETRNAVFENLEAGAHIFKFRKYDDSPEGEIQGNLWTTLVEGPGVGTPDNALGNREDRLGIATAGVATEGRVVGEYALRTTPASQSLILGTLLGDAAEVRLLDKQSFSNDGSQEWYKIQFKNEAAWQQCCPCAPDPEFNVATEMYNSQTAWITGNAVKGFIPFTHFMQFIRAFEAESDIQSLSLRDRITHLRRFYSESSLQADRVIGTGAGASDEFVDSRPTASGLYQMLKLSMTGVILPNGEKVDAGHIILTMDAYNFPNRAATVIGEVPAFASIFIDDIQMAAGGSHAVSSWSGDIGAAAGDFLKDHIDSGATSYDQSLVDWHYDKSAPFDDLMGNLDGMGMQMIAQANTGTPAFSSIAEVIGNYYGIGQTNAAEITGNHRSAALAALLRSYGFTSPTGLAGQTAAFNGMLADTIPLARIWFIRALGGRAGYNESNSNSRAADIRQASTVMLRKYMANLEGFASSVGLTSLAAEAEGGGE